MPKPAHQDARAGLPDRIWLICERFGLRPAELAQMLGVCPSLVSHWARPDASWPGTKTLLRFAALGISLDWLITGTGREPEWREPVRRVTYDGLRAVNHARRIAKSGPVPGCTCFLCERMAK